MKKFFYGVLSIMMISCGACRTAAEKNPEQAALPAPDKQIVISFDDGPSEKTGRLLEVLRENRIKAIFFLVGQNIRSMGEQARQIHHAGHEIGNHSDGFSGLGARGAADENSIRQSLAAAQLAIREITGTDTPYFRAPNLDYSDTLTAVVRDMGMAFIGTTISSRDWEAEITTEQIIANVLDNARDGGIILMHERHSGDLERTIRAVPVIARELRARGYEFVTLEALIKNRGARLTAGGLYNSID